MTEMTAPHAGAAHAAGHRPGHKPMNKTEKRILEVTALIGVALLLWWLLEGRHVAAASPAATSPAGASPASSGGTLPTANTGNGPAQPINLSFQTMPANVTLTGSYEAGYVPLWGFLGYGSYY
jgi:hypothetical protein